MNLYSAGFTDIMVFIEDAGSMFDAPVDRVWKLNQAHTTDSAKIHPSTRNNKTEMTGDTTFISSWETDGPDGKPLKMKIRGSMFVPLGIAFEILEGPMAGSQFFNYYIDRGDRTGVTVVGNFKSPLISEEQLKPMVLAYLEQAFNEDAAYLAKMPR